MTRHESMAIAAIGALTKAGYLLPEHVTAEDIKREIGRMSKLLNAELDSGKRLAASLDQIQQLCSDTHEDNDKRPTCRRGWPNQAPYCPECVRVLEQMGFDQGRQAARKEYSEGADAELRELVRWAQHHVPRDAPQCTDFLDRALAVLGHSESKDGYTSLAPKVTP
jgi:hypothetical protein